MIEDLALRDISVQPDLTMNLLWSGHSDALGEDVFLKFGNPSANTASELCYMRLAQNADDKCGRLGVMAPCHIIDEEDRIIVMPNLMPGSTLASMPSLDDRVEVLARSAKATTMDIASVEDAIGEVLPFGDFRAEMAEKIARVRESGEGAPYREIMHEADASESILGEIGQMSLPSQILHGDLHGLNILRSGSEWVVIDPMGIVGEDIYATCKFSAHEVIEGRVDLSRGSIMRMQSAISEATGQDLQLLLRALYVDVFDWLEFAIRSRSDRSVIDGLAGMEKIIESELR